MGAPLLLVMGAGGHHRTWGKAFLGRLAAHFDVVTYDQRGIGDSSGGDRPFGIKDLAADALAVLDWAGVADAHVVGLSTGGTVAQALALDSPERIRTLSLLAAAADSSDTWGEGVLAFAAAARTPDPELATRLLFEAGVSAAFAGDEENFQRFLTEALAVEAPASVVKRQLGSVADLDNRARLKDLRVPTLVMHGTKDAVIKPSAGERLADSVPGALFRLLPGVGHLMTWEAPDTVADAIIDLAKGVR
jgi:pimeloyl-ACP methyl ester carboxylesterase